MKSSALLTAKRVVSAVPPMPAAESLNMMGRRLKEIQDLS